MNQIVELKVDKIAAVDAPANRRRFLLVKRADGARASPNNPSDSPGQASSPTQGGSMNEHVNKIDLSAYGLTDEAQDQLRKSLNETVEAVAEEAAEAARVEAATEDAEGEQPEGEDVEKAELPEPVRKRLEAAETQVAELRKAARTREYMEKAERLSILGGDTNERADLLMKVADGDTEAFANLEKALADAQAQIDQSDLFKAVGADGQGDTSEDGQIRKRAEEIRKADPNLTKEAALVKAYRENPRAYDAQYGA